MRHQWPSCWDIPRVYDNDNNSNWSGSNVGVHVDNVFGIESCGARLLAPRPRNAPLSFAPTRTGPKNSKFYGPTPDRPDYIFPGPDRPDFIFPGPDQTETI